MVSLDLKQISTQYFVEIQFLVYAQLNVKSIQFNINTV